ncbi:hypothetical protein [Streptomyces caniferus]|uniref:hypothetical protein n=1 Tax=Streptomyces caniferus TaxID=285557 RepID=UPI00380BF9EF
MAERQDVPTAPELVIESDGSTQTMSPSRVRQALGALVAEVRKPLPKTGFQAMIPFYASE